MVRGPAIVFASNIWGDANMYAAPHPHTRYMTDRLVELGWQVIRHDVRGTGSSQRDVADVSLDARVLDLHAVTAHAGLQRFSLAGVDMGAAVAIAYAEKFPARVASVVALNGWTVSPDTSQRPTPVGRAISSLGDLSRDDWEFYTLTVAKLVTELDDPAHTQRLAETFKRSTSPEQHEAYLSTRSQADIRPLIGSLQVPVLVVHDTGFPFASLQECQRLAAGIPDARLVVVEGDRDAEIDAIDTFLRTGSSHVPATSGGRPAGLTPRETEVLRLIAAGRTNQEISSDLVLSVRTVARHITNIYGKIGARSKADATAYAIRHNLT